MLVKGSKPNNTPWVIGIESPKNKNGIRQLLRTLRFKTNEPIAVMTSGTYRNFLDKDGKQYSHIIDPRYGRPIIHRTVSVTVIHDDATLADAWSTAFLCLGAENGIKFANKLKLRVLFVDLDNDVMGLKPSEIFEK